MKVASSQSAPRRGRPPSLTRDRIVEAALKLTDESSLEDLSMRSLANELDVPVMTIYNYVANKEELAELVVDHVLRTVQTPSDEVGSWENRMRLLQHDARAAMRAHPGLSFSRHGSGSREARRLAEVAMIILRDGGFGQDEAAIAFAALFTFMLGQIELDVLAESVSGRVGATFDGMTASTQLSRDELFEVGLDVVLTGISARTGTPRA